jgi:hypothetical protein
MIRNEIKLLSCWRLVKFIVLNRTCVSENQNDVCFYMLSQVIEYIHFLQEKVHMYEDSHQMWYQSPTKLIPWVYSFSYLWLVFCYIESFLLHFFRETWLLC